MKIIYRLSVATLVESFELLEDGTKDEIMSSILRTNKVTELQAKESFKKGSNWLEVTVKGEGYRMDLIFVPKLYYYHDSVEMDFLKSIKDERVPLKQYPTD